VIVFVAISAGCTAAFAVLVCGGVAPRRALALARTLATAAWRRQQSAAAAAGLNWLDGYTLLAIEVVGGALGGGIALLISGLPVLGCGGLLLGAAIVRAAVAGRAGAMRRARQDATVEAVRTLRQLLETGAVGVQQAMAVLAEKGPPELRPQFRLITSAGGAARQREAWLEASEGLREPLFDMLAASVLVQRPSGGELVPLFCRLEESVTAVHEVTREAEALGVQARSAAALILCLPLVFLGALAMLRSPYLDAYRQPAGELFLAAMLSVMGGSYVLILRWLRLPEQPRLRLGPARA
jgi:Flp pilus assembly protein TadB